MSVKVPPRSIQNCQRNGDIPHFLVTNVWRTGCSRRSLFVCYKKMRNVPISTGAAGDAVDPLAVLEAVVRAEVLHAGPVTEVLAHGLGKAHDDRFAPFAVEVERRHH